MKALKTWLATAAMLALTSAASAAPLFQGRLADGTASATCTPNGAGGTTKCAMFYSTTLDVTILNDWNIGRGTWSATAAAGSAQALAASAGAAQTDFTGWLLPTGDGKQAAGPLNQYLSIWNDVGGSLAGLQAQFDGVASGTYWSGSKIESGLPNAGNMWYFGTPAGNQPFAAYNFVPNYAAAVRPGDVAPAAAAAPVPEPQTLALALLALGATVVARKSRSH